MRRLSRLMIATLCTVALVACSGPDRDLQLLEENLEAQEQALDALRTRVTDLVDDVGSVRATDPMTGLSQVADRLEDVIARLADLESDLAQQIQGGDDEAAATATQIQELTTELSQLHSMVEDLSDQTGSLRAEVDQLRREVQDMRDNRD